MIADTTIQELTLVEQAQLDQFLRDNPGRDCHGVKCGEGKFSCHLSRYEAKKEARLRAPAAIYKA